jgi:hypothetical protein
MMPSSKSPNACLTITPTRQFVSFLEAALFSALVMALAGSTGCENKAIGRRCDVRADSGTGQIVANDMALECPSRICVKPQVDPSVPDPMTTAYCTAECSKDSDCDGERRDTNNNKDFRCKSGFVCGVGFEVGNLCCKKICLCKDFTPAGGVVDPPSCDKSKGVSTCKNL